MLYQLSYSRSMTYGWRGLDVSIQDAIKRVYHSTQRVGLELDVAAVHGRGSESQERPDSDLREAALPEPRAKISTHVRAGWARRRSTDTRGPVS